MATGKHSALKNPFHALIAAAIALLFAAGAAADDIAWPSDFWTVFSNRVTTVRAAETSTTAPYAIPAAVPVRTVAFSAAFGTVAEPFDSRDRTWLPCDVDFFDSTKPRGVIFHFR